MLEHWSSEARVGGVKDAEDPLGTGTQITIQQTFPETDSITSIQLYIHSAYPLSLPLPLHPSCPNPPISSSPPRRRSDMPPKGAGKVDAHGKHHERTEHGRAVLFVVTHGAAATHHTHTPDV